MWWVHSKEKPMEIMVITIAVISMLFVILALLFLITHYEVEENDD